MASCPDSDNSWVLAGSEVGKAGLGTALGWECVCVGGGGAGEVFLQDQAAFWVSSFLILMVTCVTSWGLGEGLVAGEGHWAPESDPGTWAMLR